ncbi:MAG: NYN domain-containing protein [Ignavibacteriales bacterium]
MGRIAVLIDGGYLAKILERHFGKPKIDYQRLVEWIRGQDELFRTYYYDCRPRQSANPTPEERAAASKADRFFHALQSIPRLTLRFGRLQYKATADDGRPLFAQKGVDLQLGLDAATLVFHDRIDTLALLAGDSDLLPAVKLAKNHGVVVKLVHGPKQTYNVELWEAADERLEITTHAIRSLGLQ